jgi:23S rRNA pseudouridine2605 synthase
MNARGRDTRPGQPSGTPSAKVRVEDLSPEARRRLQALRDLGPDGRDDFSDRSPGQSGTRTGGRKGKDPDRDDLLDVEDGVRLQKVMAEAGVGSRRHCEELIGEGRVEVDGQVVRRFGAKVDPEAQVIRVDGKRIPSKQGVVYLALNKPARVLTAMSDDSDRKTIADFLGDRSERLYHVGRLDYDTEGLLLLTNDGELANRLAHPRYEVLKTYTAEVPGPVTRDVMRKLAEGVELEDGPAKADKFRVLQESGHRALVEITLHEGRNRIVRRMMDAVGHPVSRLVRTTIGPVKLGSLRPGTTRDLTTREIGELYAAVGL